MCPNVKRPKNPLPIMDDNFNKAEDLLRRFQNGTSSLEEEELIKSWFSDFKFENQDQSIINYDKEVLFQRILIRLAETETPVRKYKHIWWSIAAAAIMIFAFTVYQWTNHQRMGDPVVQTLENDVLPGKDEATMVLADGREIELNANGLKEESTYGVKVDEKLGIISFLNPKKKLTTKLEYHTIKTGYAGQYTVILPDGSKVKLNSNSSIRFPIEFGRERNVEMVGEAFFEVAKDENKKFTVDAGYQQIEVLGTQFNIKSYPEEYETTTALVSGSLRVRSSNKNDINEFILKPGELVKNGKGKQLIVDKSDSNKEKAWEQGEFFFDGENLQEVLSTVARWYNVKIIYEYQPSPDTEYGGIISRNKRLSTVLKLLEDKENVNFEIKGKEVIVKKRLK